MSKRIILFAIVPVCMNAILIGLYFSGNQLAQYIVAPQIDWLHRRSWREFGLLEQLQNIFLISIVLIFLLAATKREIRLEKILFFSGAGVMLLLVLEEIDYGIHFYELMIGHEANIDGNHRNLHNFEANGKTITDTLKKINNVSMIVWFLIMPLLALRVKLPLIARLIPSRWFILGFLLSLGFSDLAHYLDDQQLDMINGVKGSLVFNVSEFRETSTYYFFLLYAIQLTSTSDLFSKLERENHRYT